MHYVAKANIPYSIGWNTAFFVLYFLEYFQYSFIWWPPYYNGVNDRIAESLSKAYIVFGYASEWKKYWIGAVKNFIE